MSKTSYSQYIESIAQQFIDLSGQIGFSKLSPLQPFSGLSSSPRILILSPHPDDECLMAGVALRMQEDWGSSVTVVPFSYGSDPSRRAARAAELQEAIKVLKFDLRDPRENERRDKLTDHEFQKVMNQVQPDILISPHLNDQHPVHIEAAFMAQKWSSKIKWVQTEYWKPAEKPNWFVPLSSSHLIQIGNALSLHRGEVSRNPYHLSLPGWFMDQARRAPEVLHAHGKNTSFQIFGQLLTLI